MRTKSIFSYAARPSGLCPGLHQHGASALEDERDDSRRTTVIYALAAIACMTGAAATLTGGALLCRYGQLCRRVKGLRYRWQIRYREVSNMETGAADAKN